MENNLLTEPEDALLLQDSPDSVSEIVRINDQDVASYMEQRSALQRYQDTDARYNQMFLQFTRTISKQPSSAFSDNLGVWPGKHASQKVEYANGTIADIPFLATFQRKEPFIYRTGTSAWKRFCAPPPPPTATNTTQTVPSILPQPTQYPNPVVRESRNALSGYFLDEPGFDDVAVLLVPTFGPQDGLEFANTLTKFLARATAAHKKRLIIDVSTNLGGTINLGLDMFRALFPQRDIYTGARFRAHEAARLFLKAVRNVTADSPIFEYVSSTFALPEIVHPDQTTPFATWGDVYGPHDELGTPLSSLIANVNLDVDSSWQSPVRGFGPVPANTTTTAPFAPHDILVITDGSCTSTCTIFLELLRSVGVRSLVFGGRPQYGPMQAIGGSKGCQVAQLDDFTSYRNGLQMALKKSAKVKNETPALSTEEIHTINAIFPRAVAELPMYVDSIGVNFKNAYRVNEGHMPLQFVYEPADCRLFYTLENVVRPETMWASAAKAFWGGGKCVSGPDVKKV